MKVLYPAVRLLGALLFGWISALLRLLGRLLAWIRRLLGHDGRSSRGADTDCVPIRHPEYVQPDPMIYSQWYLMSLGFAVTWDNPDIELRRGGVPVPSSGIAPDTDYEIVARIWNGSTSAPVVGMAVGMSYIDFGMGVISVPIGVTKVDLGVKGGPGCPAFASMPWRSPATPGHYCLQVAFDWFDDANPLNNLGQENLQVGQASSPAEFEFTLGNQSDDRHVFAFEVDTYELPAPPPCPPPGRGTPSTTRQRPRARAPRTTHPEVSDAILARHDRADHPVPEGWSVHFNPERPALAPGDSTTVKLSIEPPTGFVGSLRFNVRAVDGDDFVAGGITLEVVAT
ncbi:MAG: hypothetical protein ABI706_02640 [Ilumatobacteraceae bacterium]